MSPPPKRYTSIPFLVYYVQSTHWDDFSRKRSASLRSSDDEEPESVLPETPVQSSQSSLKRVKLESPMTNKSAAR